MMGSVLHQHTKPPLTPSLLHSCVPVGWFVTSRSALWMMKSVKPPLTFTPRDAYKPPSSLPCLRVSPPLGTCWFKDGQQSEEMPAIVKFSQIVGAMSLGLLRAHTHSCSTAAPMNSDTYWGISLFDCFQWFLYLLWWNFEYVLSWDLCCHEHFYSGQTFLGHFQDGLQHFSDSARKHTKLSRFIPTQPPESMTIFPFLTLMLLLLFLKQT